MATPSRAQYSIEQLKHLRQSPLVQKPEALPSIEQWIEYGSRDVLSDDYKLTVDIVIRKMAINAQSATRPRVRRSRLQWAISPLAPHSSKPDPELLQVCTSNRAGRP